jgi:hypothetical protein
MGARNRVGIVLSYRPARLYRLAESISWNLLMGTLKVLKILARLLCRKAKVLEEKYRTEEAIGILRRVTRLYPNNKPAQVHHVPQFSRILISLFSAP